MTKLLPIQQKVYNQLIRKHSRLIQLLNNLKNSKKGEWVVLFLKYSKSKPPKQWLLQVTQYNQNSSWSNIKKSRRFGIVNTKFIDFMLFRHVRNLGIFLTRPIFLHRPIRLVWPKFQDCEWHIDFRHCLEYFLKLPLEFRRVVSKF